MILTKMNMKKHGAKRGGGEKKSIQFLQLLQVFITRHSNGLLAHFATVQILGHPTLSSQT